MTDEEIDTLLAQSGIVQKLTRDYEENAFFNIFRLMCLSEIPYAERLPYTQKVLTYVSEQLSLPEGYSYTGHVDYIVPCYNAMLLEAYTRLGKAASREVQNALNWVKQYQVFDRNQTTTWKHDGICRHGGCMRSVPCYIGIGKTMRALAVYADFTNHRDREVELLLKKGTGYMLRHNMYQRLSNHGPISAHITDIMFPQAYMLTVTDLVYIAGRQQLWSDPRTSALKELVESKAIGKDSWKIDYIYSHRGYKAFDGRSKASEWVDYLFQSSLYGAHPAQLLRSSLDKLHTTEMGAGRIRRNLGLGTEDVVSWCIQRISHVDCKISRKGKNWYAETDGCIITVNASSYTIITAHKL